MFQVDSLETSSLIFSEKQSKMFINVVCCSRDWSFNSLTTEKQTTEFSSANFQKKFKSKLYHTENSKTRGQTV